jgi:hypothetical protein
MRLRSHHYLTEQNFELKSEMAMSKVSEKLINSSIQAALSAIEIYNKPDFKYREQAFAILILNAWELLLKAKILSESTDFTAKIDQNANAPIIVERLQRITDKYTLTYREMWEKIKKVEALY